MVTQADREIEQKLRDLIGKRFPKHGIIGEAFGAENQTTEFVWVINSIDGTRAFMTGKPLFCTIISKYGETRCLRENPSPSVIGCKTVSACARLPRLIRP